MTSVKTYDSVFISPCDVFGFLGVKDEKAQGELLGEVMSVINETDKAAHLRLCFSFFPCSVSDGTVDLGFCRVRSRDLAKNLQNCTKVALVCATVGLEIDRLIAKYSRISPARALILQSAGAAAVESALDAFSRELADSGLSLRPRFSCGYGDLPLLLQRDIFAVLECEKNIGVSLTDSLLMTPTKSVSAIIGIK